MKRRYERWTSAANATAADLHGGGGGEDSPTKRRKRMTKYQKEDLQAWIKANPSQIIGRTGTLSSF